MSMKRILKKACFAGLLATVGVCANAQKAYNAAGFGDFSGPYAGIFAEWLQAREATLLWWNKTVGSKLGVRLDLKEYDNRYDTAQTASMWPTVKAQLNPVIVFGVGGPDVAALQQRLPEEKIPMVMGGAGLGYSWKADSWVFNPRPSLAHEFGAFLEWQGEVMKRPVRFAVISSEATPAYVDYAKGLAAFAKGSKKAELVETLNTEVQPADLTLQIRRIANSKVDFILVPGNTAQVVAVKRALQALNLKIPVVMSSYNGFLLSAKGMGGVNAFEGDYEVCACALSVEGDSPARQLYELLKKDYGLKSTWNTYTLIGMGQALYPMRAIERAIAKVGTDRLTGSDIREALISGPFKADEFYGLYPGGITLSRENPFPVTGMAAVATLKDGRVISAATAPIPPIAKW